MNLRGYVEEMRLPIFGLAGMAGGHGLAGIATGNWSDVLHGVAMFVLLGLLWSSRRSALRRLDELKGLLDPKDLRR